MFSNEEIQVKLDIILEKKRKLFHFSSNSAEIISDVRYTVNIKYKMGVGKAKQSGTGFLSNRLSEY